MTTPNSNPITFTRIKNDANGNPRYVCHFLNLNTDDELEMVGGLMSKYQLACKRANLIGGKKYTAKAYGGGIVFQSYSLDDEVRSINEVTGRAGTEAAFTGYRFD